MTNDLETALREEEQRLSLRLSLVRNLLADLSAAPTLPPISPPKPRPAPPAQLALPRASVPSPPAKKKSASGIRAPRYSTEEIEEMLAVLVQLLGSYPKGLRLEGIKNHVKADKRLLQKALELGRQSDQVLMAGAKRAATYTLPSVGSKAQASGRVVRRKK